MNLKTGCLIAGVLLLQASLLAAPRACPAPGAATPKSMTWSFSNEATRLMKEMDRKAYDVRTEAAKLAVQARVSQVDWQTHAAELNEVRYDINRMGENLCRLETIREQLPSEQQRTVDKTALLTKEMATFTNDAIEFLNGHHDNLWNPSYRTYIDNLQGGKECPSNRQSAPGELARRVRDFEKHGLSQRPFLPPAAAPG